MKRKINLCLILPSTFDPDMLARPAVIEIFGKIVPFFGHKVTWILPYEKGADFKNIPDVVIHEIKQNNSSCIFLKIINKLIFYFREFLFLKQLLSTEKFDIIQVRNDLVSALIIIILRKLYHYIFVFQYTIAKNTTRISIKGNSWEFFFRKFEMLSINFVLKQADHILPISKWMEKNLSDQGIPPSKMTALPMGINPTSFISFNGREKIRKKYSLDKDEIVIGYIGTMDKRRELNLIIDALSIVKKQKSCVRALFVGDGSDRENLINLSTNAGLSDVIIFTGKIPYVDIPEYIDAVDLCLCPVPPLPLYLVSSPTKMYESMIMKKPVVANIEIPEQKEVIEKSGCGILVKFNSKSFAEGIIELLNNPQNIETMGKKGYEWVIKNRSYQYMADIIEQKYYDLLEMSLGVNSK